MKILFVFICCLCFHGGLNLENFVINGDFSKGNNHWDSLHTKPNFLNKEVEFLLDKNNQHILLQSVHQKNQKFTKNPILFKFSHKILNKTEIQFNLFQYVNIRLTNGSFLPVWNFAPKILHEWETDCVIIPYRLNIQNILIVIGMLIYFSHPLSKVKIISRLMWEQLKLKM
jgi:hypothetical protein